MSDHVDIVKSEMDAGRLVRVGRVRVREEGLEVERFDAEQCWVDAVWTRELVDPDTGTRVDPHEEGERYLGLLHTAMSHPSLYATAVHAADECPFAGGQELQTGPVAGPTA